MAIQNPDDVGGALTGQTDPATASSQWDDYLQRPGNRQALLQIGLQMMQPVAMGQSAAGHVGQAIGAGGEAVGRIEEGDLKEKAVDQKLAIADAKLQIAQQNANTNLFRANTAATRAAAGKTGGLTDLIRSRYARQDAAAWEKQLENDAKDLVKQSSDLLADPNSDVVKKYKGKTKAEIRDMLRAERPKPQYGAIPTNDTSDETDLTAAAADTGNEPVAPSAADQPPVSGAQKAQDGNWYLPDPKRPGKYLKVK